MIKECSKCKAGLPIEMFGPKSESPDGHRYECKICQRTAQRNYYYSDEERRHRKVGTKASHNKYCKANPKKRKAKQAVHNAIIAKKIAKSYCIICAKKGLEIKAHAHHCDYNKPLEVMWLCPIHHKAWHRVFMAAA